MVFGKTYTERSKNRLWFAWIPVRLDDGRVVWMETIERDLAPYHSNKIWRYSRQKLRGKR